MLPQVTGDETEGRSGRPKACSEYKSASGRLRLSETASSGNGDEAEGRSGRPKACSEYKSTSGRLRLSETASSGNGEVAAKRRSALRQETRLHAFYHIFL